jgi:hypothetical protein
MTNNGGAAATKKSIARRSARSTFTLSASRKHPLDRGYAVNPGRVQKRNPVVLGLAQNERQLGPA